MNFDTEFFWTLFRNIWPGVPVSFVIVIVALVFGLPLGYLIAIARFRHIKVASPVCTFLVSFIRGTPMIVQIYICYSLLPSLLNALFQANQIDIDIFNVPYILYAFVVFVINTMAISSEAFRGSLSGVDKGQMEAAVSIGLSSFQAYRRIIIPQTLVSALPVICNITINLLKGTSLVYIMGVMDITAIAREAASLEFCYVEAYLVLFILYLVFGRLIELGFGLFENHLKIYKGTLR